jgi:hypothetical protein
VRKKPEPLDERERKIVFEWSEQAGFDCLASAYMGACDACAILQDELMERLAESKIRAPYFTAISIINSAVNHRDKVGRIILQVIESKS